MDRESDTPPASPLFLKVLSTLVAFLISLLVCFGVTELGFRVYGRMKGIDFQLYQKELVNSDRLPAALFVDGNLKPNAEALATTSDFSVQYKLNSLGFRDQEYSSTRPEGKTRVLLYGDSFTFGEGVPYGQRFGDVLESSIPDVEVINFGVPGAGIDESYLRFKDVGKKFHPDYVILAANWLGAERYSTDVVINGYPEQSSSSATTATAATNTQPTYSNVVRRDDPVLRFKLPFSKWSYFLSYMEYQYIARQLQQEMSHYDASFWQTTKEDRLREDASVNDEFINTRTVKVLKLFQAEVERSGAKFIIINIDDKKSLTEIMDHLTDVTYFNYKPQLAELAKKQRITFNYDLHYTPATNEELGKWLTADFQKILESRK